MTTLTFNLAFKRTSLGPARRHTTLPWRPAGTKTPPCSQEVRRKKKTPTYSTHLPDESKPHNTNGCAHKGLSRVHTTKKEPLTQAARPYSTEDTRNITLQYARRQEKAEGGSSRSFAGPASFSAKPYHALECAVCKYTCYPTPSTTAISAHPAPLLPARAHHEQKKQTNKQTVQRRYKETQTIYPRTAS